MKQYRMEAWLAAGLMIVLPAAALAQSGASSPQNPLLGGYAAIEAYLPSKKIAIAVAVTFAPEAFDSEGNYANSGDKIFRAIGAYMAPDDAPPMPKKD